MVSCVTSRECLAGNLPAIVEGVSAPKGATKRSNINHSSFSRPEKQVNRRKAASRILCGRDAGDLPKFVFISSESAVQIPPEMVHYGTTKTAQVAVARGIAESVAGTGVTVNSILAGPTESEGVSGFVEAMAKQQNKSKQVIEKEFFEHVRPSSLLKRFATVNEVAAMVSYVASELSSATNGAALRVDGGVVKAIL